MQSECTNFVSLTMNATTSKVLWGLGLATIAVLASWATRPSYLHAEAQPYHSRAFMSAYADLPDTSNALFTGSGKCAGCHGADPVGYASVTAEGHDINPTDPVSYTHLTLPTTPYV